MGSAVADLIVGEQVSDTFDPGDLIEQLDQYLSSSERRICNVRENSTVTPGRGRG